MKFLEFCCDEIFLLKLVRDFNRTMFMGFSYLFMVCFVSFVMIYFEIDIFGTTLTPALG